MAWDVFEPLKIMLTILFWVVLFGSWILMIYLDARRSGLTLQDFHPITLGRDMLMFAGRLGRDLLLIPVAIRAFIIGAIAIVIIGAMIWLMFTDPLGAICLLLAAILLVLLAVASG